MTRIVLTAIALVLANPGLASDQLEAQLGVPTGLYTTSELVRLTFAESARDMSAGLVDERRPGRIIFSSTDSRPAAGIVTPSHQPDDAG